LVRFGALELRVLCRIACGNVADHAVHNISISSSRLGTPELLGKKISKGTVLSALAEVFVCAFLGGGGCDEGIFQRWSLINSSQAPRRLHGVRGKRRRGARVRCNRAHARGIAHQRSRVAAIQDEGDVLRLLGQLHKESVQLSAADVKYLALWIAGIIRD